MSRGKIIKGIAGFYYVHVDTLGIYECKAKGIFRKNQVKPLVGDDVVIEVLDEDAKEGSITEILPRKNELIRPAAANVDQALVVFALANPAPNLNLLDRFLIMMDYQNVPTTILFNKSDLVDEDELRRVGDIYADCGCNVMFSSTLKKQGLEEVKDTLRDKTTILAGPSGVGKSSLTNFLLAESKMETGDVSRIGRGRHTTRHSEIFCMCKNSYICDTPGFTSLMLPDMEANELRQYIPEFVQFEGKCRFNGCVHVNEPDCAVKQAVSDGIIGKDRYDSYVSLYDGLKRKVKY
jgi:ribosome biogenesis GTPase